MVSPIPMNIIIFPIQMAIREEYPVTVADKYFPINSLPWPPKSALDEVRLNGQGRG
jgi:hypothetical protein